MALLSRFVKREKILALRTRTVVCLGILLVICAGGITTGAFVVLWQAGYWWLAILICPPMGTGYAWLIGEEINYCRPGWLREGLFEELK